MDLTPNYELLAMIYKNRPQIAYRARELYAIPEENPKCIDIQMVRRHNDKTPIISHEVGEEAKLVQPIIEGVVELGKPMRRTLVESI
jgi:hypothetical protein